MKMNRITLTFLLAACCLVGAASEITGILKLTPKQANQNGEIIEIEVQPEKKSAGRTGLSIELGNVPGGRRLVCRAEFRGEKITQTPKGESGLRLQFAATTPGGPVYQNTRLAPYGDFDWTPVEVSTVVPFDATAVCLNAGLQGVSGKLFVRNIKITSEDLILDLRSAVNMGYADPVAGDGKGGWSDQGPTNDASRFRFRHVSLYAGMPFQPLDPAKNDGKAVVTMHSLRFAGPKKIPLVTGGKLPGGRYLYLLHGLTWGGDTKGKVDTNYIGKPVGALTVHSVNGREHRFEIVNGRDVADWWELRPLPNATVGVTWRNGAVLVGLYATRFELPKDFGPVESVAVESASSGSIWLIVGLTLSEKKYDYPQPEQVTITAGEVMRPIEFHPKEEIAAGSALDRSGWLPRERAGDSGRVIVNAQGHFAFEKEPERAIRFFANCDNPDSLYGRKGFTFGHPISQIDTKEKTRAYVAKLRRAGYNMTRLHGVDGRLMLWAKEEAVFDPVMLDRIDYFIHCLKESGIYINFDLMSTRLGYLPGNAADAKLRPELTQKLTIHADPAARADWRKGVEKLLTRVNPYTKTRLIDDPVLAMVVCYNEQEFGLSRPRNWALLAPSWQAFLQKNHGDIGGLNRAWGTTYAAFAAIPLPTPDQAFRKDAAGCDAARYFTKLESDTDDWYRRQLREIGYRGLTANHNMSRSRRYLVLRDAFDFVASNGYHDHPHGGFGPGCSIRQSSSVGSGNMIIRSFISTRLAGKPMLTTEQDQAFWNRYRYEFAFTCGAYAAFQDFDGMTHFAANQTVIPIEKIRTFVSMIDPINHANEFLNFFLFVRGDVATSPHRIRLQLDREEMFTDGTASDGLNASQVRLALVTGFTPEVTGSGKTPPPSGENEIVLGTSGSSQAAAVDDGYASLADSGTGEFNFGDFAGELKRRGFLLKENRTDPKAEIFETDTGELLLDVSKRLLTVNTERLQGVAAEAGTRLRLKDFEVEAMSRRGCLAAVSLDGLKPLREAERLMLVYATNALNSKMIFDDKEETTLRSLGELPVLLETGKIRVKIRNRNAANLRVWSLSMEGKRLEEITPVSRENGELRIEIDTAKLQQGPAVFFELAQ